jgi:3-hydroxy-5-methyl-1-naphthoate 3-O-methyltransferase
MKPEKNLPELLRLMTAYQQSRVLFTFLEFDIPQTLSEKKLTAAELAEKLNIHPLAMDRFLNAAVSVGLLKKTKEKFVNSEMTNRFLLKGTEFFLGGQVKRQKERSYQVWENLTEKLKQWKEGESEEVPEDNDQGAEAMAEQHRLALFQGYELAKAFDFSKYKRILDLGGGTGATSIALCKTYPKLNSIVFDLPENSEIAREFVEKENLSDQIETIGGDFKKDDLPDDFDAVLLANFMSVAEPKENQELLQKVYRKLPHKGVCLISGWIIDNSRLSPQISVLFCLEDICWNAPDVERSEEIYKEWLKKTGFKKIKCETYSEPTKMLYGFK